MPQDFDDTIWQSGNPGVSWDGEPPMRFEGTVIAQTTRSQTDIATGELKRWSDGNPKKQAVITLANADGELMDLYVKIPSNLYNGIRQALRVQDRPGLREGDLLAVTYASDGPKERGRNPQKIFEVVLAPGEGRVPPSRTHPDEEPF